jgi:hypothetical protein
MTSRELRPGVQENVRDRFGADEKKPREIMEASEKAGLRREGSGGAALHRRDPNRGAERLSLDSDTAGFARLNLMVGTIFDRLVAEHEGLRGS